MTAGPECHEVFSISYRKYLATFQCVLIANVSKQEVIYCYRKTFDGIKKINWWWQVWRQGDLLKTIFQARNYNDCNSGDGQERTN